MLTAVRSEKDARYSLVRMVECTYGELPIRMVLKATPQYATASSTAQLISMNTGAVISGGEQHLGLTIASAHQLSSFSMFVEQDIETLNPTVIAQAILRKGDRLVFAVGMASTLSGSKNACRVSCAAV